MLKARYENCNVRGYIEYLKKKYERKKLFISIIIYITIVRGYKKNIYLIGTVHIA